jgi:hypothetical protein
VEAVTGMGRAKKTEILRDEDKVKLVVLPGTSSLKEALPHENPSRMMCSFFWGLLFCEGQRDI